MYNYNKKIINSDIKKLKKIIKTSINKEDIKTDIFKLKQLKHFDLEKYFRISNVYYDKKQYEYLKTYDNIVNPILDKHIETLSYKQDYPLKIIKTTQKENLEFIKYLLNSINKNWYNKIYNVINENNNLNYKYNNQNYITMITSLNKFYISLSKNDNLKDYTIPIHELLHIYSLTLNKDFYNNIETEFLSLLGEIITCYELYQKNIEKKECIKTELNTNIYITNYITDLYIRKYALTQNIKPYKIISKTSKYFNIKKSIIKDTYLDDLFYIYDNIISYFLAIELFEIYKKDKEKCFYLCDKIILDKTPIETKLNKYNINLLENDTKYIKTLKKEYEIINNQ